MKTNLTAARVLAALLTVLCLAPAAPAAPALKALIVTGQNNHNWPVTSPVIKIMLEDAGLFTVDTATSPKEGGDMSGFTPKFADYSVVVLDYTGDNWPEPTRKAFLDYVSNGGGVVVVHAADNAFPDWPEFNEIIGLGGWGNRNEKSGPYLRWIDGKAVQVTEPGPGGGHGKGHAYQVVNRITDHPVTKGLPEKWMHANDELYHLLRGPGKNLTLLSTAYSDKGQNGTGNDEPILFTIQYGKGRIFHTVLGHAGDTAQNSPALQCVGFITTLQRGAEWAATGQVTQAVPDDFPTADTVSLRASYRRPTLDSIAALLPQIKAYKFNDSLEPLVAFENVCRATTKAGATTAPIEDALLDVLDSNTSVDAKRWACKVLSLYATEKSLSALFNMFGDRQSADTARLVLQRMPGIAADQALLGALKTAEGPVAAGIAQTLGARGTAEAVAPLTGLLANADPAVVTAAAEALADLGAAQPLVNALANPAPETKAAIEDALLRCAQRLSAGGGQAEAKVIFASLNQADRSDAVRGAALAGIIAASGADMPQAVGDALKGDARAKQIALRAVRLVKDPKTLAAIAATEGLDGPTQALLFTALADTKERSLVPVLVSSLNGTDDDVRLAAIAALGKIGGPDALMPLATLAGVGQEPLVSAARAGLRMMPGVGEDLAAYIPATPAVVQLELVRAAGARRDAVAAPALIAIARDGVGDVRAAALKSLGEAAPPSALPGMLALLTGAGNDDERAAAAKAVAAVAAKAEPGDARTGVLVAALKKSQDPKEKAALCQALGAIADDTALAALGEAAASGDGPVATAAVGALAAWPTPAPLDQVRALAKSATGDTATAALRGTMRLLGLKSDRPKEETVKMYAEALAMVKTPGDHAAVIEGLGETGDPAALPMICNALNNGEAVVAEAAVKALGGWPDATPIDKLVPLAKDRNSPRQITALRGYVRLIGLDAARPTDDTVALYREAMALAANPDEQKRVMSALGNTQNVGGLLLASEYLNDPNLSEEAAAAVVKIAKSLAGVNPDEVRMIMRLVAASSNNESVKKQSSELIEQTAKYEDYLTAWQVSGPYTAAGKKGEELFDMPFAPEEEGARAEWKPANVGTNGAMPFLVEIDKAVEAGNDRVAYLRTFVHADKDTEALLELGSDDGAKVWVNGKQVLSVNSVRPVKPASDKAKLTLKAGWNTLLVKVSQGAGQWAACARLRTADGAGPLAGLKFAATPQK
jgi:HEAT repeat protein/type 1 glutamine amidotransferase